MSEREPLRTLVPRLVREYVTLGQDWPTYLRSLLTPRGVAAGVLLAVGLPLIAYRFWAGLASVTNLSQATPWGLWIGFDMLCGVALAAGGYTIGAAVYLLGLEKYRPVVRPALLTGFLGYLFAVIGLLCDLGQPWRIPYPLVYSYGTTSVMFEVGWCVALYTTVLFLEFCVPALEWLGMPKLRKRLHDLTIGLVCLSVVLSTLHQSSLGALFLLAPGKLHPLWYSGYIPVLFFVSSIVAGLSMVIVESGLSHRAFRTRLDPQHGADLDEMTLGLARGAAVVLFGYLFLKLQALADSEAWALLRTGWGLWYLVEVVGFVIAPCALFAWAAHHRDAALARGAASLAVLGVVLNRVNVAVIAFNWNLPNHYVPSVSEFVVSATLITLGVLCFAWIVNRMPILHEHPAFQGSH